MAACASARTYTRRIPEQTVLYRIVAEHLAAFVARTEDGEHAGRLPAFVRREFEAYLGCGLLDRGCVHVRCERCGDDMVVAFSCKSRGFCPSCGGRRMTQLAAQLVDRVIPAVPVRQWVLSLPWTLRYQLAFDAGLCRAVLGVFVRAVLGWLRAAAEREGIRGGQGGAVTVVQRFGGALNLNVHFHSLVLDGVFTGPPATATPVFHALPAPTDEEIAGVLGRIHRRVQGLLRRRGRLPEAETTGSDPVAEQQPLLAGYAAASIQGLVAGGPRAGQRVRRLRTAAAMVDGAKPRCARLEGFSLHANVSVPAHARARLEHLCRYLLRPPLAGERLRASAGGLVLYELAHPRADGATHLLLDPLELLEKLSVLVPAPRTHQLRYHGVLAPHAAWRSRIVPGAPEAGGPEASARATGEPRRSLEGPAPSPGASARLSWAALLKRVFALDVFACPRCGGRRRLVGVYSGGARLRELLERLGLEGASSSAEPSRAPPEVGA